jgi:hypothetical protein
VNKVQVGVTTVFYDQHNMTKKQAVRQAEQAQERCRRRGSVLRNFTASIPRKGEPWYEKLRELKLTTAKETV